MGRRALSYDATVQDAVVEASETTIAHQLGRTPQEVFVITKSASATVYRGSTAWDGTNIYIQASATVSARLLIF
jgi:hypothetical protein